MAGSSDDFPMVDSQDEHAESGDYAFEYQTARILACL